MGKVISFRLTDEALKSLDNLMEHWGLDNRNQTLNKTLNDVWEVLRDKPALEHLRALIEQFHKS
jgi:DNA-binding PadR family transcriptional regulator